MLLLLLAHLINGQDVVFTVSVGEVHNDSTVSVVCFDIAGILKQKVRVALQELAAPQQKCDFTSRESFEAFANEDDPVFHNMRK